MFTLSFLSEVRCTVATVIISDDIKEAKWVVLSNHPHNLKKIPCFTKEKLKFLEERTRLSRWMRECDIT